MNHLRLEMIGAQVSQFFCKCYSDEPSVKQKALLCPLWFLRMKTLTFVHASVNLHGLSLTKMLG